MSAAPPAGARPRLVEPNSSGGKRIKEVRFGLLSTDEMEKLVVDGRSCEDLLPGSAIFVALLFEWCSYDT